MTTATVAPARTHPVLRVTARVGWAVLGLLLAAFAVFEAQKYGVPTTAAAVASFAVPALFRRHALARAWWIPLTVLVGYSLGSLEFPPLFTAGLGWMTLIVALKVFRRG
ncbi:hypothetical protein [Phytomonospora endophytica]|uniref:Uncharacterized protein n=1 Tax=Phytomonospora endophytica TaxID=714109 RepID=A0A841G008_9ACTN|nr:hypothetical protein [Phytomonospora endophytica]MBB6037500.1 hypothetical protein [Phytomonospora endophytica]GIG70751.1 hypothetical protein Pen01_70460 [Phytomonospora endophytica]